MQFATPNKQENISVNVQTEGANLEAGSNGLSLLPPGGKVLPVQRKCEECEEEQLRMFPFAGKAEPVIQKKSADLPPVQIHQNSGKAIAINAQAFTKGTEIHFAPGKFNTNTTEGLQLLGHELVHVSQQQQGLVKPTNQVNGEAVNFDPALEKEADQKGKEIAGTLKNSPKDALFNQTESQTAVNRGIIQRRALSNAEKEAAKRDGRAKFDEMSVRIIQSVTGIAGAGIDGILGDNTVQAISNWQTGLGITDNGIIDVASLDQLVAARNGSRQQRHEAIRLVTDYYNIDITTGTLTLFASRNAASNTTFETGMRVVEIGTAFFASSTALRDEINAQLGTADPAPVMGPDPPPPTVLNASQVRSAISYNKSKYDDPRSIAAIQHHMGVMPSGTIDEAFVQRVAQVQNTTAALADVDGKIGRNTLEHFFTEIRNAGNHNAVIRMIIDFYDMPDYGLLTSIFFEDDAAFTSNASTGVNMRGPAEIRVRKGLYQSFEGAVHTIRHELEHIRQNRDNVVDDPTAEFLGEAIEIMSVGMSHETLFNVDHDTTNAAGTRFRATDGLLDDAGRARTNWRLMPVANRRTHWARFVQVRNRLRQRVAGTYAPTATSDAAEWAAASAADQAAWTGLLTWYNAERRP